jgi:hypothetical protein
MKLASLRCLAAPCLFAAATIALTWPLALGERAYSARGDYYLGLWNAWWAGEFLRGGVESLYFTEFLHHPIGASLARHELSPFNAFFAALLSRAIGFEDASLALVLVHFWLSGWFMFLFARALSGSFGGALMAGLVYGFSPFHFYYLSQMNVVTLEFIPLAGWFMVRSYRHGRARDFAGVAASAGLIAATSSYFVVYTAMLGGLLLAGGRLWDPDTPVARGAQRLALAGLGAAIAVGLVAWPLLSAGLTQATPAGFRAATHVEMLNRSNDLLGYRWVGPPEVTIVSWPTMLGYSSLLILIAGLRRERRQLFWIGAGALFALASLGPRLHVGGTLTSLPLPYAALEGIPVLGMLRKPDRFFAMVELCFAVSLAFSWGVLAARLSSLQPWLRRAAWSACAASILLELCAVPLSTFPREASPWLRDQAHLLPEDSLVELPSFEGSPADALANYHQTMHHKKIPQGYVVDLTLTAAHRDAARQWTRAYEDLVRGDPDPVTALARRQDIGWLVLDKRTPMRRKSLSIDRQILSAPFFLVRRPLLEVRQRGHLVYRPIPERMLATASHALEERIGPAEFEDAAIIVFRVGAEP